MTEDAKKNRSGIERKGSDGEDTKEKAEKEDVEVENESNGDRRRSKRKGR